MSFVNGNIEQKNGLRRRLMFDFDNADAADFDTAGAHLIGLAEQSLKVADVAVFDRAQ